MTIINFSHIIKTAKVIVKLVSARSYLYGAFVHMFCKQLVRENPCSHKTMFSCFFSNVAVLSFCLYLCKNLPLMCCISVTEVLYANLVFRAISTSEKYHAQKLFCPTLNYLHDIKQNRYVVSYVLKNHEISCSWKCIKKVEMPDDHIRPLIVSITTH